MLGQTKEKMVVFVYYANTKVISGGYSMSLSCSWISNMNALNISALHLFLLLPVFCEKTKRIL